MIRLGVNIDHVATVRQARGGVEPEPIAAAILAETAGADGIVCHLREDRRHIRDRDLDLLRRIVTTQLNLEMAAVDEMVRIASKVHPDMVTLVPERREELTTEGGLEVIRQKNRLKKVIKTLHENDIEVSIFIDPDTNQIEAARETGAGIIEIHTGMYANALNRNEMEKERDKIINAARFAKEIGLKVSAGHGLNYKNVQCIAGIKEIEELNIGHSIISRAIFIGMEAAVREMKRLILNARC